MIPFFFSFLFFGNEYLGNEDDGKKGEIIVDSFFFFFRREYETNFCLDIFANTVTEKLDQFITMSISFEESITRVLSFLFFFADEIFFRIEGKRIIGKKIWKACFLLLRF